MATFTPDFRIKRHDRLPSIEAVLTDEFGEIPPLTGATVKFTMLSVATATVPSAIKVDTAGVIVDVDLGKVRYDWTAQDTDAAGDYLGEWQVTYSDGRKQTFPSDDDYHAIRIYRDLDNA